MVHYTECPSCKSAKIKSLMPVKDHSVSGEIFTIYECDSCSLRFTQDVPEQNNISRYYQSVDYISHSDTKVGMINRMYHLVRSITLSIKRSTVTRFTKIKSGSLLDIGGGTGAFLNEMKQHGWEVTGLEPDITAVEKAKSLYNISAQSPDVLFNLPAAKYDAITMWHVLEHVHQLQEYVIQLKKIIKDTGVIFIAVPNYTSYDARYYKEYWAAYDVPRHLYHFSPESMKKLMEMHGFKIKAIRPMWFDSFYVSLLSEKYKNSRHNIFSKFDIGLISNVKTLFNKQKCSSVIYVVGKK